MKLRLNGNSIRLRLSHSDLQSLDTCGYCEEQTFFQKTSFRYRLSKYDGDELSAQITDNRIEVFFPGNRLLEWLETDLVALEHTLSVENGALKILVEKDWQCLTPRDEDESNLFKNPNAQKRMTE